MPEMNLVVLTSVDSTNNYLQQLTAQDLAAEGTVVLGLEQTRGRGQRGKSWESHPGLGLYCSVLFQPPFWHVEKQFVLNKAVAVGVAQYLESKTAADIRIKWPNDIMADGKKIAGILIENNIRGQFLSAVVAGVGINLNHPQMQQNFETPATSLFLLNRQHYDAETEVQELFRFMWQVYRQLVSGETEWVEAQYQHRLYRRGERAAFIRGEEVFFGVLEKVNDAGQALINVDGVMDECSHPAVRFLAAGH